ncbi:MAG: hypothetical protein IPN68_03305 [Bacteroidetes bacterium]|nr:hypothetical protein [Bacteroidota bacterium]
MNLFPFLPDMDSFFKVLKGLNDERNKAGYNPAVNPMIKDPKKVFRPGFPGGECFPKPGLSPQKKKEPKRSKKRKKNRPEKAREKPAPPKQTFLFSPPPS